MGYALENQKEFSRLEFQATMPNYDYRRELQGITLPQGAVVVDAGSGSGVVSRYLAEKFPSARVRGFDFSDLRVKQAELAAQKFDNLMFEVSNLNCLPMESDQVDLVILRFVLEHLSAAEQAAVLAELFRCLKPGGRLVAVDIDGWFQNMYPTTPWIEEVVRKFNHDNPIDLRVGRKIPALLAQSGFEILERRVELMNFEGEELAQEATLIESRVSQCLPSMSTYLGSKENVERFRDDVLRCLESPNAVLFYSKFIVTGMKPKKS